MAQATLIRPTSDHSGTVAYWDDQGYDCEGYGLTAGLHKRTGIRRYYRPGIDTPTSEAEVAATDEHERKTGEADRRVNACYESIPATDDAPWGGHDLVPISHEEDRCTKCGGVFPNYSDA